MKTLNVRQGQLRTWNSNVKLGEKEYFLISKVYREEKLSENSFSGMWADAVTPSGIRSLPISIFEENSNIILDCTE